MFFLLGSCGVPTFISGKYKGKNPHVFVFQKTRLLDMNVMMCGIVSHLDVGGKRENVICLTSFQQRDRMPVEYMKTENSQSKGL